MLPRSDLPSIRFKRDVLGLNMSALIARASMTNLHVWPFLNRLGDSSLLILVNCGLRIVARWPIMRPTIEDDSVDVCMSVRLGALCVMLHHCADLRFIFSVKSELAIISGCVVGRPLRLSGKDNLVPALTSTSHCSPVHKCLAHLFSLSCLAILFSLRFTVASSRDVQIVMNQYLKSRSGSRDFALI
jgi:hypothetical protein